MDLVIVAGNYDGTLHGWHCYSGMQGEHTMWEKKLIFAYQAHRSAVRACCFVSGSATALWRKEQEEEEEEMETGKVEEQEKGKKKKKKASAANDANAEEDEAMKGAKKGMGGAKKKDPKTISEIKPTKKKTSKFDAETSESTPKEESKRISFPNHLDLVLVSGGSDEIIKVYDVASLKELGELTGHDDNVLSLEAISGSSSNSEEKSSFVLSGSQSGMICVWQRKDLEQKQEWNLVHTLKGHKLGPVSSIAAHIPSAGALALTTCSKDNSLRLWDLAHGRAASRLKIDGSRSLDCVCWSAVTARYYALVSDDRNAIIFDTDLLRKAGKSKETDENKSKESIPGLICRIPHERRINGLVFFGGGNKKDIIASGSDDGFVRFYSFSGSDGSSELLLSIDCTKKNEGNELQNRRVRKICKVDMPEPEGENNLIAVGLSDGTVQIYHISSFSAAELVLEMHAGTGAHLTAMCCASIQPGAASKKRPRET